MKATLTDKEILDAIRRQLPVGYIPNHTDKNLPEMVMYHVKRSCLLGGLGDDARAILESEDGCDTKTMIRFLEELVEVETF